ncbi:cholesterol 24-hydroxylase-like [Diadema setosum]|uniref:cholesterol 24-hydroxylase-like n=1 Tax=Diadema setosum TaxID=31175 RepID=UPI003B3BB39F
MEGNILLTVVSYVILLLTLGTAALIGSYIIYVKYGHVKYSHIPGPARTSFIWGNYTLVAEYIEKDAIRKLTYALYQEFGIIHKLHILHYSFIFILDAKFIKSLLTNSAHPKPAADYKHLSSLYGQRAAGKGLLAETSHSRWEKKRALINTAFQRQVLKDLVSGFNQSADNFINHLIPLADGQQEVRMMDQFSIVTLDVIARVGFGMDIDVINESNCPFPRAVSLILKGIMSSVMKPWLRLDPSRKSRKFRREVREAVCLIRDTGSDVIIMRKAAKERGEELPLDILTHILIACDYRAVDDFGMEEMIDEFITLFIAGHETTSNLLAFTIQQLSRFPSVYEKVQVELEEVIGDKKNVSYDDVMSLEYLSLVLKETLRMYPPVQGTSRTLGFDVTFGQYHLPRGSHIVASHLAMCMMDRYFDDPEVFRPERFQQLGDTSRPKHIGAYFPFSLGQRSCIGQHFALIAARVILAKLLRSLRFQLVPGQTFTVRNDVTIKPRDGCVMFIEQL